MDIKFRNYKIKGFTLIEMMVVLVIGAIILSASFGFLLYGFRNYSFSSQKADVQTDVRQASDYLVSELRNATEVFMTYDPLTDPPAIKIDPIVLTAKYPSVVDASFEIQNVAGTNKHLVKYSLEGNTSEGNRKYEISSSVLLNRVGTSDMLDTAQDTIYYRK